MPITVGEKLIERPLSKDRYLEIVRTCPVGVQPFFHFYANGVLPPTDKNEAQDYITNCLEGSGQIVIPFSKIEFSFYSDQLVEGGTIEFVSGLGRGSDQRYRDGAYIPGVIQGGRVNEIVIRVHRLLTGAAPRIFAHKVWPNLERNYQPLKVDFWLDTNTAVSADHHPQVLYDVIPTQGRLRFQPNQDLGGWRLDQLTAWFQNLAT